MLRAMQQPSYPKPLPDKAKLELLDVDAILFPKPKKKYVTPPNSFMRTRIGALVNSQRHVPTKWTPWFMEKSNG